MKDTQRIELSGSGIVVRGNDIDTDRIIPARYLRTVTFEGLGVHAFEDDRAALARAGKLHPFDAEPFASAEILLVNKNFGCGSSREHAPQALNRWNQGIKAVIGESFAEIFYGNCISLGIPCPVVSETEIEQLMTAVEHDPRAVVSLDLKNELVTVADLRISIQLPEGPRQQFLNGRWDSTTELLEGRPQVLERIEHIPYIMGF